MIKTLPQNTRRCLVAKRIAAALLLIVSIWLIPASAQVFKSVHDGVEYAEVTREFSGKPVKMNLLRLDLTKVRLDVHHANEAAIGLETTSAIAKRHNALAAINAGFFRLDQSAYAGDAAGILQINGKLLSEVHNDRVQLLINNGPKVTDVFIARLAFTQSIRIGGETLELTGINRERKENDLVMYTPEFGRTTITGADGVEVVVMKHRVASVHSDMGSSVIPHDGYVLSASGSYRDRLLKGAVQNGQVTLIRRFEGDRRDIKGDPMAFPSEWDIVAGVPQLIRDGVVNITWEQEKASRPFVENRHPRTAVARLRNGKFLMLTADGRSDESAGLDLYDLANFLLELGAVDAMNLDGGGSTTMYLGGRVVNSPSDKEGERKVSDAIVVTPRGKRGGKSFRKT